MADKPIYEYRPEAAEDSRFVCAECGQAFKSEGAVRLHHFKTHEPGGRAPTRGPRATGRGHQPDLWDERGRRHSHHWRLLVDDDPVESAAIADGYRRICTECGDLE